MKVFLVGISYGGMWLRVSAGLFGAREWPLGRKPWAALGLELQAGFHVILQAQSAL